MRPTPLILVLLLSCMHVTLFGQQAPPAGKVKAVPRPYYIPKPSSEIIDADSAGMGKDTATANKYLFPYTRQVGKKGYTSFVMTNGEGSVSRNEKSQAAVKQASLLSIHGNVLYNVDYRSYIDTPYAEHDVYYHTVQTYLDITYKNSYPMRVYLTNRFSNSAFSRKFTDVNMQFNTSDFRNRIRQRLKEFSPVDMPGFDSLQLLQKTLAFKKAELSRLNNNINSAATIQKIVELRERAVYPALPAVSKPTMPELPAMGLGKPNIPDRKAVPDYLTDWFKKHRGDNTAADAPEKPGYDSSFLLELEIKRRKADSLRLEIADMEKKYKEVRSHWEAFQSRRNGRLNQAVTLDELEAERIARHVPDSALPAGYKTLWAVKSFGIGRTLVDYSELSAKNVSVKGVQIEYNPSYYVAVAAGTIDYRFRDYVLPNNTGASQYLAMVRVGRGLKNSNNIILTWYTGKKQLYNSNTTNAGQPDYRLMGFTLEGNYKITPSTYATLEIAKSSLPFYNRQGASSKLLSSAVSFNDHSNEAYSLKLQSLVKATGTRLSGFYKHYGANFQSFSLITTGVEQDAWMLKADQPLWKNRLLVGASVKKNDYTNPAANVSYQSNIVFKSVQATLRIPKWPVLFAGYYPSSQLTKLSDNAYTENMFYSLVASLNHYYKAGAVNMGSTAMYTRFYNKQSDSVFIYSNSTTLLFNQAVFFHKLTYQAMASVAMSADYNLYTLGHNVQYNLLNWLTLEAGIKYNKQTNYNIEQFGCNGGSIIKVKKLGEFQFVYEKGFIPGVNRQLVANNTGRFSYFRIF